MVRMGAVWDSTTEVLAGRGATIVRVAMLTLFLPSVLEALATLAQGEDASVLAGSLINLVVAVITLMGTLAIVALASDPRVDERGGYRIARETLLGGIVANLILGVAFSVLLVPGAMLLAKAGFDLPAALVDAPQPKLDLGMALWAMLYLMLWSVLVLWAIVRLAPLHAVVANERRGASAIGRAFGLTRGLAFRLTGVVILFLVVWGVVEAAATSVVGLIARLMLGPDRKPLLDFIVATVDAIVITGAAVMAAVFCARLYAAIVTEREEPQSL